MLESDQLTFPSFAPSLSQSPKPLRDSTQQTLNSISIHKMSINVPDYMIQSQRQLSQISINEQNLKQNTKHNQQIQKQKNNQQKNSQNNNGVKIYCRLRPHHKQLYQYKYDTAMIDDGQNCYTFDNIFGKFTSQQYIFKKIATRHMKDFSKGKNSTIFAYGQTGSGKTFTMFGDLKNDSQFGIIPRTLQGIFNTNHQNDMISCSMLQIYNQKMMDLFVFPQQNLPPQQLKLKQINDQIFIQGLVEVEVQNKSQILDLVRLGHKNRKVASTYNNDTSSRSHTVLFVYRTFFINGIQQKCKLCFIDLAGSQKVRKSGVKGQTLQQAKKINLSLSCLGNVIHALTSNSDHIPYRNSKLTRILKDSLSGETNTSIITTCSTDKIDYHETISTIKFAVRAKKIKNKKKLDNVQLPVTQVLKKLKKQLQDTKKQLNWYKMKQQLQKCNLVDIPQEDACLMPLKSMMITSGLTVTSRINLTRISDKISQSSSGQSRIHRLGQSSRKRFQ